MAPLRRIQIVAAAMLAALSAQAVLANPVGQSANTDVACNLNCPPGTGCSWVTGTASCQKLTGPECGAIHCATGEKCCSPSCGMCGKAGGLCPAIACISPASSGASTQPASRAVSQDQPLEQRQTTCGPSLCKLSEVCCNESCGTCVAPGQSCSQEACLPAPELGGPCGPNTCDATEVCCNKSCGICTPPDGACSQEFCGATS